MNRVPATVAAAAAGFVLAAPTALAGAAPPRVADFGAGVPTAQPRVGHPPNVVPAGVKLHAVAVGTDLLENPVSPFFSYGYLNDAATQPVEATKTEPDQNTYLVFRRGLHGADPGYDYGHRFLFQGHEGTTDRGYVTRINLDVQDPSRRISLLTLPGKDGTTGLGSMDGSTWDPFTRSLLVTSELAGTGGVSELGVDFAGGAPARPLRHLDGVFGHEGYEGIHPDDRGNVYVVADVGGTSTNVVRGDASSPKKAKQPNSFVYRLVPNDPTDLSMGGRLEALQVRVLGSPLRFHAANVAGDVFSGQNRRLRNGSSYPARWVTIHNTDTDGTAPFDANALAKSSGATPFKRPENGAFRPGSGFRTFVFAETGDTDATSGDQPELAARGAWGSLFRLDLRRSRRTGRIRLLARGDSTHASFDNITWADADHVIAAEDRGDGLHTQLNRLDSAWIYDLRHPGAPVRALAEGRDPLAEQDAAFGAASTPGFQNEGDNEITGFDVSDGDPSIGGLLGTESRARRLRWFVTQQHGANVTYELRRHNRR